MITIPKLEIKREGGQRERKKKKGGKERESEGSGEQGTDSGDGWQHAWYTAIILRTLSGKKISQTELANCHNQIAIYLFGTYHLPVTIEEVLPCTLHENISLPTSQIRKLLLIEYIFQDHKSSEKLRVVLKSGLCNSKVCFTFRSRRSGLRLVLKHHMNHCRYKDTDFSISLERHDTSIKQRHYIDHSTSNLPFYFFK